MEGGWDEVREQPRLGECPREARLRRMLSHPGRTEEERKCSRSKFMRRVNMTSSHPHERGPEKRVNFELLALLLGEGE